MSKEEISEYGKDVFEAIPRQFQQRLPAGVTAQPQNAEIFRRAFRTLDSHVDRLFARLGYREGEPWEQWKLLAAFYLVECQIGKAASTNVGTKIFETMPWPPSVTCLEDALEGLEAAYRASHEAGFDLIGGWPVIESGPGYMKISNATPYPCYLEEGTLAGVCNGFRAQRPTYRMLTSPVPKRQGGEETIYEVSFLAKRAAAPAEA